jgi:hypothetical protein
MELFKQSKSTARRASFSSRRTCQSRKKVQSISPLGLQASLFHEEGLAMELLGMFYMSIGNKEAATSYLMGAQACYVIWGANAALDEHLSTLLTKQ